VLAGLSRPQAQICTPANSAAGHGRRPLSLSLSLSWPAGSRVSIIGSSDTPAQSNPICRPRIERWPLSVGRRAQKVTRNVLRQDPFVACRLAVGVAFGVQTASASCACWKLRPLACLWPAAKLPSTAIPIHSAALCLWLSCLAASSRRLDCAALSTRPGSWCHFSPPRRKRKRLRKPANNWPSRDHNSRRKRKPHSRRTMKLFPSAFFPPLSLSSYHPLQLASLASRREARHQSILLRSIHLRWSARLAAGKARVCARPKKWLLLCGSHFFNKSPSTRRPIEA